MKLRSFLREDVKERLMVSEGLIGMLAERMRVHSVTIKQQLKADSPTLCLPHYVKEIKDLLGLPEGEEITVIQEVSLSEKNG